MSSNRLKIVVLDAGTLNVPERAWNPIQETGELCLYHSTPHNEPEVILQRCKGARIVLSNKVPLSAATLAQLPELRLISTLATGYNVIDTVAARKAGITVCNVPSYSTRSVAQHTLALMLELCNRVGSHNSSVQNGKWVSSDFFYFCEQPMVELHGRTVGLLGYGAIAEAVGRLVHAFGAKVLAYRRNPQAAPDYQPFCWATSVEHIFAESDILSLHCPLSPGTLKIVNQRSLALMKKGAFLINTARGGLIAEADLVAALQSGHLGGAALDVASVEPMAADSPLLGNIPNLYITPHVAWASPESQQRLLTATEENIRAFLQDKPINVVN